MSTIAPTSRIGTAAELVARISSQHFLNYPERACRGEFLAECAIAEEIRKVLVNAQEHQIDLLTALGEGVPDVRSK